MRHYASLDLTLFLKDVHGWGFQGLDNASIRIQEDIPTVNLTQANDKVTFLRRPLNSRDPGEIEAAAGSFDFIISTVNVKLDWNFYLNTLRPKGRLAF